MFSGLLSALYALTLLVGPAPAAETKTAQPYVVLVGISEYKDKAINPRPHAEDDARALYDLFTRKEHLGVDADHIRLLLGSEDAKRNSKPATKQNILDAVKWVRTEAKADDQVIFAFFGQGCSLGERGDRHCYFASDSTLKGRDKDAVDAATLGEELDKLKSHQFCAFIDVNFKGYTSKDVIPEASLGSPPYKEFLGDDGSEEHSPASGRVIFLATNGLSQSLDLPKHGVFTQIILDGLEGKADKEGYEPDGVVTVDELGTYLRDELPKLVKENGKTKEEKEQAHFVLGSSAHFTLTTNPSVVAKVEATRKKLLELEADKKVSAEMAEEGRVLLSRMPRLEAQRKLRQAYQKLVDGTLTVEKFTKEREKILESRKLSHEDAVTFAKKVMETVSMLRVGYVKEVNQGDLVNWAIRGLYKRVDEKLPAEVQEKLGKVKTMTKPELTDLLASAREGLGTREDLDKGKDLDVTLQRMMSHLDPYTRTSIPRRSRRWRTTSAVDSPASASRSARTRPRTCCKWSRRSRIARLTRWGCRRGTSSPGSTARWTARANGCPSRRTSPPRA